MSDNRRRYQCAQCGAQFLGPDVELEPGKVVVCEDCWNAIRERAGR